MASMAFARLIRWLFWGAMTLGLVISCWLSSQLWPRPLVVGRSTTYLTGPLRPDGTVDYVAALDAKLAEGVTYENNAAVPLIAACGPELIEAWHREEVFKRLGLHVPESSAADLQSPDAFAKPWEQGDAAVAALHVSVARALRSPWRSEDNPMLAACLVHNRAALAHCVAGSQRSRFYLPLPRKDDESYLSTPTRSLQYLRAVAHLLALRTTWFIGQGDINGALADTLALHRWARLMAQYPSIVSRLTAHAIESLAVDGDFLIILTGQLSADQADRHAAVLAALPNYIVLADLLDYGDRCHTLSLLQLLESHDPYLIFPVDRTTLLTRTYQVFDECVQVLRSGGFKSQQMALGQIAATQRREGQANWPSNVRAMVAPTTTLSESLSSRYATQSVTVWQGVLTSEYRQQTQQRALQIGYALARHRATHGVFPNALADLVPTYLPELPNDTFTAQPFRYELRPDHQKFLLYSLGPNGQDDQGHSTSPADDIAWGDVRQD